MMRKQGDYSLLLLLSFCNRELLKILKEDDQLGFLNLLEDNYLTILCWFLPYTNMNHKHTYVLSVLNLLPTSHPSRWSQSTRFELTRFEHQIEWISHSANSHWLSILHMITYMFQYYSLSSSHPLLPSLCSQVRSLCLCLHCRDWHFRKKDSGGLEKRVD